MLVMAGLLTVGRQLSRMMSELQERNNERLQAINHRGTIFPIQMCISHETYSDNLRARGQERRELWNKHDTGHGPAARSCPSRKHNRFETERVRQSFQSQLQYALRPRARADFGNVRSSFKCYSSSRHGMAFLRSTNWTIGAIFYHRREHGHGS